MFRRPQWRTSATRKLVSAGAAAVLAATGLVGTGSAAQAAQAAADKIRPELAKQLQAKSEGDFWIRFGDRADLSKAKAVKDWAERGTAVAQALRKTAAESQQKVRADLDAAGVKYQTFWATNAIKVSSGSWPWRSTPPTPRSRASTPRSSTRCPRPPRAPTSRP
ncbi:hypothetical protein ACFQZ4_01655 [Catellatospora coxensis]